MITRLPRAAALALLPALTPAHERTPNRQLRSRTVPGPLRPTWASRGNTPRLVGEQYLDTGFSSSSRAQPAELSLTARGQRILAQLICSYDNNGNVVALRPAALGGSLSVQP